MAKEASVVTSKSKLIAAMEVGMFQRGPWRAKSWQREIADGRLSKHIFLFEQIEEEEPV